MDIESLQIKRITGNWDTHKTEVKPEKGEMIFIEKGVITTDSPGYIVIGDGTNTVDELVSDSSRVVLFKEEISSYITNLYPNSSDNPGDITSVVNQGDSKRFARANHSHKIDNNTINNIVQSSSTLGDIVLRKVYAGEGIPDPTKGFIGDIYIKYN